ncbi:PP2C family protein-serine/threonine phosphatase [Ornithinibacillus californiensis]|uniref:PP2C family protein-serine/threonine phosphatase n=1 Tax=Ornithinibacillus californiensis TaxID=161536 RepID=UPI00064D81A3|nr:PP2C family protein-serine/threonine phosphatase [Ornithinibacillus californiensis]
MDTKDLDARSYTDLLKGYIKTQDERALYGAEQISKSFIKNNILPEEIVNLHIQALLEIYPDLHELIQPSMNFLLEAMISYGLAHQEYQQLREKQLELRSEIHLAARMQQILLQSEIPQTDDLDIGVISVPANQMNGDYHHFVRGKDGSINIAIADIIGKGIPAALSMSMIKYAMDSFPESEMSTNAILKSLNRVVERNVDPSMFITMFYATYKPDSGKLFYSSAGHEPGFFYSSKANRFKEIEAKGLVLGVKPDTTYSQYELELNKDDMVILLTDGVTECRKGDQFIERDEVLEVIRTYMHLPAQEIVNRVYRHFERIQNFQLKDDFTLVILKKVV